MTKMTELFARQGVATEPDEYERAKEARRHKNLVAAHEVLTRNHIAYEPQENNWFRIEEGSHLVHYHPPTGEWSDYGTTPIRHGYGIRNLVRHLRGSIL